jgi:hypothetical protein
MMPCQRCSARDEQGRLLPFDQDGKPVRGLKQLGKTKLSDVAVLDPSRDHATAGIAPDARGERIYRCLDCGARWRMTYNALDKTHRDEPVLELIQGSHDR